MLDLMQPVQNLSPFSLHPYEEILQLTDQSKWQTFIGMNQIMGFNCSRENYVRANAFSLYMHSI